MSERRKSTHVDPVGSMGRPSFGRHLHALAGSYQIAWGDCPCWRRDTDRAGGYNAFVPTPVPGHRSIDDDGPWRPA